MTHRSYYNLDGIIFAKEPVAWRAIATLGEVETADDFERLTGARPNDLLYASLPSAVVFERPKYSPFRPG
jgi:hypothetical protein